MFVFSLILLCFLQEYDFRVRWPTVKLLTVLLRNQGNQIQQAILVSPLGMSFIFAAQHCLDFVIVVYVLKITSILLSIFPIQ